MTFAHTLTAGIDDYIAPTSTTHTDALARLAGARAQHTLTPAVAAMVEGALWRHPSDCTGVRHITGRAECELYRLALGVLGMGRS